MLPSQSALRVKSPTHQVTPDRRRPADALAATSPDALAATTGREPVSSTTLKPRRPILAFLLGLIVLGGAGTAAFFLMRGDKDTTVSRKQEDPSGSAAAVASTTIEAKAIPEAKPDAAVETPDHVLVTIEGAPKTTQVMSEGKLIGLTPKVQLPYGTKELALILQANGYEPAPLSIVPDHDQTVTTKLTRINRPVTRPHEPNKDDVEDPFKNKR